MTSAVKLRLLLAGSLTLLLPSLTFAQHYIQTPLVSDQPGVAPITDSNLINPWGLARSTMSPWWVAENNAGVTTIYDGSGVQQLNPVTIPAPPSGSPPSAPTGAVFNGSATDFLISPGVSAHFIFATEDGTIAAWNSGGSAVLVVDNSAEAAVYKGITTGDVNGVRYLYTTNFRKGRVEVYDTNFKRVHFEHDRDGRSWDGRDKDNDHDGVFSEESFEDDQILAGFAPFNVQNIGGSLFVTYAKQDRAKHDDVAGAGNGFVDIYSTTGKLETRLEHGSWLSSPWGVVWTPRDFGEFSNRVLVGNFGSGQIAAYDGFNGKFIGLVKTYTDPKALTGEQILTIDGLWSLTFGNSAAGVVQVRGVTGNAGPYNSLFFTAGPDGEMHGLFGTLIPVAGEQDGDEE